MNHPLSASITVLLLALSAVPTAVHAHPKGFYDSQQQAEQRAQELGCKGTHRNNGKWMPCSTEETLHQHLRHH